MLLLSPSKVFAKSSHHHHRFLLHNSFVTKFDQRQTRSPFTRGRVAAVRSVSCSSNMVKAIRVHEHGGPEVLQWEDVEIGEPKDGEIKVKIKAIGVNFIYVYYRKGV